MRFPAEVEKVFGILNENGCKAWAVGGCVRDYLLGRTPKDYDVATDALPETVMRLFKDFTVVPTGLQHGTVTVVVRGMPVEVTTLRTDGAYLDNRRPGSVTFTRNIREDQARRDFTVNAIAWNPWDGFADSFGGKKDIDARLIRCVGKPAERFGEDALRILRAVRLAGELGFAIEEETDACLHEKKDLLKKISAERINAEFSRLLLSGRAKDFLPPFGDVFGVFAPGLEADPALKEKSRIIDRADDLCAKLAVLLDGLYSMQQAREWLHTMKYDNCTICGTLTLLKYKNHPVNANRLAVKFWLKTLGADAFLRLLSLKSLTENLEAQIKTARGILDGGECLSVKSLAVNGRDLLAAGMQEGSAIGAALDRLLMEVIRERVPNQKGDLLAYAKLLTGDKH